MKILIPLLFVVFTNVNAECTNKDLTDPAYLKSVGKEKLIKHFSKPRDQDSIGWCGAYASADSLTYAVGEPVSAIDTSINFFANSKYYQSDKLNQLSAVFLDSAPSLANNEGYCPESVIPSNKTLSTNLANKDILFLMSSFQSIYDSYVAKGRPSDFCVNCTPVYLNNIKKFIPGATDIMIKEVLKKNQTESLAAFKDLLFKLCEGKRIKVQNTIQRYDQYNLGNKTYTQLIDEALDNDSMPSIGINSSYFINSKEVAGGNFDHAMVIVAKRMNKNNKCEYLVRNSYGRGCIYYNSEIAKKCNSEKGSFWMDEDTLKVGVKEMMVIKNEKNQLKMESIPPQYKIDISTSTLENIPAQESKTKVSDDKVAESESSTLNNISNSIRSIWKSLSKSFKYQGPK